MVGGMACTAVKRLRSHQQCHGEKTFVCDQCPKKFTVRAQLVRHQLVHSGVKAFVCPYCQYRSAIVENLRKHCHAVHKVLYPPKKRDIARRGDELATVTDLGLVTDSVSTVGCSTVALVEACTTTSTTVSDTAGC